MKKLISLVFALPFCFALSLQASADMWTPPLYDAFISPTELIVALVLAAAVIASGITFLIVWNKKH